MNSLSQTYGSLGPYNPLPKCGTCGLEIFPPNALRAWGNYQQYCGCMRVQAPVENMRNLSGSMSESDRDRKLLELAAKAAGYDIEASQVGGETLLFMSGQLEPWNPLTNDGDALRLAVKLDLWPARKEWSDGHYIVIDLPSGSVEAEPVGADSLAATRRAIVRAAAEIGRAMG